MGFWTDFLLNTLNIWLAVIFYGDKYWGYFLSWRAYLFTCMHTCTGTYTRTHTHQHIHFNSSWIKTVFNLCIVTLSIWRTEKKAHLICEHFRGKKTEGSFFSLKFVFWYMHRLQNSNAFKLQVNKSCTCNANNLNFQKYQKWQEELQGRI